MTLPPRSLADYETIPPPSLSGERLNAIVSRHALDLDGPVTQLASSGVVHSLWSLGSRLVLRVPKNEPMCLGDHRCEAAAIPLVRDAGVTTPALVVFDDSLELIDVPYSVVERVDGTNLVDASFDHDGWIGVGRELATLHNADLLDRPHPWFRDNATTPVEEHFDEVLQAGLLHGEGVVWIANLCSCLDELVGPGSATPQAFLHGDVKADNVMIDGGGRVHLIDWGDAGFGDPALDFASLPMRAAVRAVTSYRAERSADATLEARIVRHKIARSLSNLRRTPLLGPSWYRPLAAPLTDLLTFAVDNPSTWRRWTALD